MCEGVDTCPSTGLSIEEAPCKNLFLKGALEIKNGVSQGIHDLMTGDPESDRIIQYMFLEDRMKTEGLHTGWQLMSV